MVPNCKRNGGSITEKLRGILSEHYWLPKGSKTFCDKVAKIYGENKRVMKKKKTAVSFVKVTTVTTTMHVKCLGWKHSIYMILELEVWASTRSLEWNQLYKEHYYISFQIQLSMTKVYTLLKRSQYSVLHRIDNQQIISK